MSAHLSARMVAMQIDSMGCTAYTVVYFQSSVFSASQYNEIRAFPMIIMFIMFAHLISMWLTIRKVDISFDEMQSEMLWCDVQAIQCYVCSRQH